MKHSFLNNSLRLITKYNSSYSAEDIEKLQYGLEGLYLTITKLFIIGILAFCLGIFKETVVVLILFNLIRYPAFGFHADKSRTCLIFSILVFIGIPLIMLHTTYEMPIKILLSMFCLLGFCCFAPADTPKRPLSNAKKRKIRKIVSIVLAILYILGILFIPNAMISDLLLTALIIETIMINPMTYRLFHQSFNNYKFYIPSN